MFRHLGGYLLPVSGVVATPPLYLPYRTWRGCRTHFGVSTTDPSRRTNDDDHAHPEQVAERERAVAEWRRAYLGAEESE